MVHADFVKMPYVVGPKLWKLESWCFSLLLFEEEIVIFKVSMLSHGVTFISCLFFLLFFF